jgi:hypothetical protein
MSQAIRPIAFFAESVFAGFAFAIGWFMAIVLLTCVLA